VSGTPRLLAPDGRPRFQLTCYALNQRGEVGAASFFPSRSAAREGQLAAVRDTAWLFQGTP
jgi:hypothetical protein